MSRSEYDEEHSTPLPPCTDNGWAEAAAGCKSKHWRINDKQARQKGEQMKSKQPVSDVTAGASCVQSNKKDLST